MDTHKSPKGQYTPSRSKRPSKSAETGPQGSRDSLQLCRCDRPWVCHPQSVNLAGSLSGDDSLRFGAAASRAPKSIACEARSARRYVDARRVLRRLPRASGVITSREARLPVNGGASPACFQGGGLKAGPPLDPPPAINLPFSIRPGSDARTGAGGLRNLRMSEKRRRTGAVWCWPAAKFLHWKPRRREPHTPDTLRTRLRLNMLRYSVQKPHCPQCEGRDELEHLSQACGGACN